MRNGMNISSVVTYQPLSCKQANLEVPSLVSFPKPAITFLSFFFPFYLLI